MAATTNQLNAVVSAARALLGARQDQMVTAREWDDLAAAVEAVDLLDGEPVHDPDGRRASGECGALGV